METNMSFTIVPIADLGCACSYAGDHLSYRLLHHDSGMHLLGEKCSYSAFLSRPRCTLPKSRKEMESEKQKRPSTSLPQQR